MKPKPPTKQQLRSQMESDVNRFLESGGHVTTVQSGLSGRPQKNGVPEAVQNLFLDPKGVKREYLTDVVKTLESRKHTKATSVPPKKVSPPKKVPIYDDFGEIIRYEWR